MKPKIQDKMQKRCDIYPKNIPTVKNVRPCSKWASVENVVKSKGVVKKWLWWYRLIAKILITAIQVNIVLIPSEAGIRQHKLTWIVVNKIFAINLYHHSHFLTTPFDFTTFFTLAHFNMAAPFFLQLGCFWVDLTYYEKLWVKI